MIKCIGCIDLFREERAFDNKHLVTYICPRFFPYAAVISGLLHPGKGILEAVKDCPEHPEEHCILCPETQVLHYGDDITAICREHDKAWSKWLNEHPERRAYLSPKGRMVKANWIEVFREFIEAMRPKK